MDPDETPLFLVSFHFSFFPCFSPVFSFYSQLFSPSSSLGREKTQQPGGSGGKRTVNRQPHAFTSICKGQGTTFKWETYVRTELRDTKSGLDIGLQSSLHYLRDYVPTLPTTPASSVSHTCATAMLCASTLASGIDFFLFLEPGCGLPHVVPSPSPRKREMPTQCGMRREVYYRAQMSSQLSASSVKVPRGRDSL